MKFEKIEWQGYEGVSFTFEGRACRLIKPNCAPNGKWALKTEYGDAFPATEVEMLSRGWHVAFQSNVTRWATKEDIALFAKNVDPAVKIKAAGGIRSLQDAEDFLVLGASRLGTSAIVKIIKEGEEDGQLSNAAY